MSVRRHRWGRSRSRSQPGEEQGQQVSAPFGRRERPRRIVAVVLMAILVLPLLFWLSWPLGFVFKANPIILAGLVALIGSVVMGVLWARRATSARQVFRRALLAMAVVALLLPLNGLPFLISEVRLARGGDGAPNPLASSTAVAMAALMTIESAIAGVVVAVVALVVRWAVRPKGERNLPQRRL